MPGLLTEIQRIPASAGRAVEYFEIAGEGYLAIPQLAYDRVGSPKGMNGGDSNTDVQILRRTGDRFEPAGQLPGTGGEDVEFFQIEDRTFVAVASVRVGSGPYNFLTGSPIYEWNGTEFEPFQTIVTYAAKQWRHFTIDGQHFLGLAQNRPGPLDISSVILRWDGEQFVKFQDIPSRGGYNFEFFELDGERYLAHADHSMPSLLYRWDGDQFVEHQELVDTGGRAFQIVTVPDGTYLFVACMFADSMLLKWNGSKFVEHRALPGGNGGREFAILQVGDDALVARVSFITGGLQEPHPELTSYVYRLHDGEIDVVDEFPTTGAVDVTVISAADGEGSLMLVANALAADATFSAAVVVYRTGRLE